VPIKIKIPQSWNELSDRQLKRISLILHSELTGKYFDFMILKALMNLRWFYLWKRIKLNVLIYSTSLDEIKKYYPWLSDELGLTTFLTKIWLKKEELFPPADRLSNFTIDEFAHADDLFLGWCRTKNFEYLQYLAALLYREKNDEGKRVPFDKQELDSRASAMSRLSIPTLLAVLICYQGNRTHLVAQFPIAFPKPKKDAKKKKVPTTSGFGKVVLHFSGGKFGNYIETKDTNVYTFLSEYEEQIKLNPDA
jgi:hypothetical protein